MKVTFPFGTADLSRPHSLAIPVAFEGERLSAFGAPPSERKAYAAGSFVGDVKQGGSCNCEVYTLNPHCCGTHTECIGHITAEPIFVHEVLQEALIPATVITVTPELQADGDAVITRDALHLSLWERSKEAQPLSGEGADPSPGSQARRPLPRGEVSLQALIIRTLPNDPSKRIRNYNDTAMPPYFSAEAMEFIVSLGVQHLLVDVPSVDRLDDGGKLANHRVFWDYKEAVIPAKAGISADDRDASLRWHDGYRKTITELIYVPETVADGLYLLNLQIAPFMADVAPSRPILYEMIPC